MYGDEHLGIKNDKFYLWADFIKLGSKVKDNVIH
jgi:long-chain-fatty-acid--CoA ligase ACSBG